MGIPTLTATLSVDGSGHLVTNLPYELEVQFDDVFVESFRRLGATSVEEAVSHDIYRKVLVDSLSEPRVWIPDHSRRVIKEVLVEFDLLKAPIMPLTDMELAAYVETGDVLVCLNSHPEMDVTPNHRYYFTVEDWSFEDRFDREVPIWDDATGYPTVENHVIQLSGEERRMAFTDDSGQTWVFTDRKPDHAQHMLPTSMLWDVFEKPVVPTVKEVLPQKYQENYDKLTELEILSGFTYYPGQKDYIARIACKDFGLPAAETGVGKTLIAISLAYLKDVDRLMIIAPKGVIKGRFEGFDYVPSQWEQEIRKFCPMYQVHRVFDRRSMEWLLRDHNGVPPKGIYIFYPQALFTNGAIESLGPKVTEADVCDWLMVDPHPSDPTYYRRGVGDTNRHGIKCVIKPSLATELGRWFDMVLVDEAHFMQSLGAQLTQGMMQLQAKYRYGLTATPIPDVISNVFPFAGWLAVPEWHRGRRSVAWPYTPNEFKYFKKNHVSREQDLTKNFRRIHTEGKKGKLITDSPIISNPSRLLRILKPIMAYITKAQCNPNLVTKDVIEVRVPFARQQAQLYRRYLNQNMIPVGDENKVVTQQTVLRSICADPATCRFTDGTVKSNFNAKTYTIMELVAQVLERGEQVVIVSSRVGITDEISERLRETRVSFARIDGKLNSELHSSQSAEFKSGRARVLLMGIKLAQGFSFDRCPNLIVTSIEWNYKTREQAFGRVWRMNSILPAKIWVVLNENSIEEVMYDKVATKESAALLALKGEYLPTNYAPVSGAALLANHIIQVNAGGVQHLHDESYYESLWSGLADRIRAANQNHKKKAS